MWPLRVGTLKPLTAALRKLLAIDASHVEGSWKPQTRDSKIPAARKSVRCWMGMLQLFRSF